MTKPKYRYSVYSALNNTYYKIDADSLYVGNVTLQFSIRERKTEYDTGSRKIAVFPIESAVVYKIDENNTD